MLMEPSSGVSSPRIMRNRVDLPAPLGPTRAIRSPQLMVISVSLNKVRPAWDFVRFLIVSMVKRGCILPGWKGEGKSRQGGGRHF